jgi:hypothetical protein
MCEPRNQDSLLKNSDPRCIFRCSTKPAKQTRRIYPKVLPRDSKVRTAAYPKKIVDDFAKIDKDSKHHKIRLDIFASIHQNKTKKKRKWIPRIRIILLVAVNPYQSPPQPQLRRRRRRRRVILFLPMGVVGSDFVVVIVVVGTTATSF